MKKTILAALATGIISSAFILNNPVQAFEYNKINSKLVESSQQSNTAGSIKDSSYYRNNIIGYGYVTKGDSVKTLQYMLNRLSTVSTHPDHSTWYAGTEDGVLGVQTYNALKNYQKSAKLTADGVCGQNTWDSLTIDLAAYSY